jgi:hypothetical protein
MVFRADISSDLAPGSVSVGEVPGPSEDSNRLPRLGKNIAHHGKHVDSQVWSAFFSALFANLAWPHKKKDDHPS